MDRFTGMAVFAKVVDTASFAEAARHFGMSPAMVSKHVRTLEERLGVRLLNRTTRRVSATEVGQNYYERCLRILSELEDAERAAGDQQAAPRGVLRLTAPVSFSFRHLAPAIADYLSAHPDVSIDLSLNDHYVDLIEERFDVAIRVGRLADSSLISRKLCSIAMTVCASPAYLEANGTPQEPSDLTKHNCLVYTYAMRQSAWRFVDRAGQEHIVQVNGRFLANNGDALLALAVKGAGIVLSPDFIVEDDVQAGRLIRLLPEFAAGETPVHAVYPHSKYLSAKTRTFIDFLATRSARSPQIKANGADEKNKAHPEPALRAVS
jgi:DNA-binding transcriptional LysR family regulator